PFAFQASSDRKIFDLLWIYDLDSVEILTVVLSARGVPPANPSHQDRSWTAPPFVMAIDFNFPSQSSSWRSGGGARSYQESVQVSYKAEILDHGFFW
ncbi:MAG: hypothetical protein PHQ81_11520, partial [Methanofollis sp.]|nr:hypothetical protein [Methanofollis sp.]